MELAIWYSTAQTMVEDEMNRIAAAAGSDGQLDSSVLNNDSSEVLQLYLDYQETWQEVCLVVEHTRESSVTLVLNRPLALQLTDSLGKLVLHGTFSGTSRESKALSSSSSSLRATKVTKDNGVGGGGVSTKDFLRAFGSECAVYVGGPDDQHLPAALIHGIPDLEGATEFAPGLYQGGLKAAVSGVLAGRYKPLEFRFFVGRHSYSSNSAAAELLDVNDMDDDDDAEGIPSSLDLEVVLGKYQPVACARSLALKQCIQLPKPLWHEVLELCGGELSDISEFELLKRDDLKFQIVDEDDDDDDDDDNEFDIVILDEGEDELDELFDDDDDDEYYKI